MSGDFKNSHFGKQAARSERGALIGWGVARFKSAPGRVLVEEQ